MPSEEDGFGCGGFYRVYRRCSRVCRVTGFTGIIGLIGFRDSALDVSWAITK